MTTRKRGKQTGRKIPRKTPGRPPIELTHMLGEGGESQVYAVRGEPELAVKIYHDHRRPEGAAAQKIAAMEEIDIEVKGTGGATLPPLAWPEQVIRVAGKDQVAGMVMPLVDLRIAVPLSHVVTPLTRAQTLGKRRISEEKFHDTRWKIARNLTRAVEAIHAAECVIGDVNDDNILTNPQTGDISIVDCDSFQIMDRENRRIHRCRVGRAEYTPPELLEQLSRSVCGSNRCRKSREEGRHKPDFSCLERRPEHDMFGIGVILFKLFMNGAHPYSQRNLTGTGGNTTLKDLIQQRKYPYNPMSAGKNVTGVNADLYENLPQQLKQMFHRTFA